ncbi:MAG TPA: hypothetical protein VJI15_00800 [Candidatus Nanoarchaeia archaeon]|nr:hypothetical protein [Candidatus Nanoarchaeia archaeon]
MATIKGKWWNIDMPDEVNLIVSKKHAWKQDPTGYFLIRINKEKQEIEAAFCGNNHKIQKIIVGKHPEEIYYTMIREGLISLLEHAANMGSELQKAYLAMKNDLNYVQDDDLILK